MLKSSFWLSLLLVCGFFTTVLGVAIPNTGRVVLKQATRTSVIERARSRAQRRSPPGPSQVIQSDRGYTLTGKTTGFRGDLYDPGVAFRDDLTAGAYSYQTALDECTNLSIGLGVATFNLYYGSYTDQYHCLGYTSKTSPAQVYSTSDSEVNQSYVYTD